MTNENIRWVQLSEKRLNSKQPYTCWQIQGIHEYISSKIRTDKLVFGYLQKTTQSMLRVARASSSLIGFVPTLEGFKNSTAERNELHISEAYFSIDSIFSWPNSSGLFPSKSDVNSSPYILWRFDLEVPISDAFLLHSSLTLYAPLSGVAELLEVVLMVPPPTLLGPRIKIATSKQSCKIEQVLKEQIIFNRASGFQTWGGQDLQIRTYALHKATCQVIYNQWFSTKCMNKLNIFHYLFSF